MGAQWNVINQNYNKLEGYKRVAWPPASEERIVREFTPQPQTQYQPAVPAYNNQQQPAAASAVPSTQGPIYNNVQQQHQTPTQYAPNNTNNFARETISPYNPNEYEAFPPQTPECPIVLVDKQFSRQASHEPMQTNRVPYQQQQQQQQYQHQIPQQQQQQPPMVQPQNQPLQQQQQQHQPSYNQQIYQQQYQPNNQQNVSYPLQQEQHYQQQQPTPLQQQETPSLPLNGWKPIRPPQSKQESFYTTPSGVNEPTPTVASPIYQQQFQNYHQQQPQTQPQQQQQYRAPSYDTYQQPQQQYQQPAPQQQQPQYSPQPQYQAQAQAPTQNQYQPQYQGQPQQVPQYQGQPQQVPQYQGQPQQPQGQVPQYQQPQQQYQQPPWVQQPQQPAQQQYQQPPWVQQSQQNHQPQPAPQQQQYQQQPPQQQPSFNQYQAPHQQYQPSQPQQNQFVSQPNQQFNSYSQPQQQQHTVSHDQLDNLQQQQTLPQDYRGASPGIITLRKEAPVTQKPAPVYTSQPAAVSYQGGSNMRGDLKWPPPEYKEAAHKENEERRQIAAGPVCRPRQVKRDYTPFFAKNALSHHYPSYKVPPGTQHMTY